VLHYVSLTLADVPASDTWLSEAERIRLAGFKVAKRREEWRLGRWTAKQVVSLVLKTDRDFRALATLEIRAAPDGAPEVYDGSRPAPIAVSISHSSGRSLCAAGEIESAVGCDLEKIEPREQSLVEDYFTAEEAALVSAASTADRSELITLIWCAKESALKSLRQGLRRDTRSVQVELSKATPDRGWSPLTVRCLESDRAFHGWWRVNMGYVETMTSALPDTPRTK
jgi:4'-phosphopantetheinyl transferase